LSLLDLEAETGQVSGFMQSTGRTLYEARQNPRRQSKLTQPAQVSTKHKLKIVVMMLTLNSAKFFEFGVLTTLKKAIGDYEYQLLVVDGGSTDRTVEKVNNVFGNKASVLVFNKRNLALCRNLALRKAPKDADFYSWVDSDIVIPRNFFSRLIPIFSDPDVGTVEIHASLGYGTKESTITKYFEGLKGADETGVRDSGGGGATTCLLMRREIAMRVRVDPRFRRAGEDVSFHLKVNEMGYKTLVDLNKPYARHVREPSFKEEACRAVQRGEARSLNVKLHKKVIRNKGIRKAVLSSIVTLGILALLVYGLPSSLLPNLFPFPFIPILISLPFVPVLIPLRLFVAVVPFALLLARHASKLKRPWKLHLAMVGLILSTLYLIGFMKGFFKYWVFRI
jgi:succinoglycan biosynthesis protein ExoA